MTLSDVEKRKIMVLNFELHFPTVFNYDGKTGIRHITAKKFSTTAYGGKYVVVIQGQHPNKILVAGVNAGVELFDFNNWHEVSLDTNTDEIWYFSEQIPNDFSSFNTLSFCSDKGSYCSFNVKTEAIKRTRASTITLNEFEKIIKTRICAFNSGFLYFYLTSRRLFIWHNKYPYKAVPDDIIEFEENYGEPVAVGFNNRSANKFSVFFKKNLVRYMWSFSESSVFTVTKENEQNFGTKTLVNVNTFLPYYWNRYNIMLFDDGGIWGDLVNYDDIVRITSPRTEQAKKIITTKNTMARVDDSDQSFMIYTYMYDSAPDAKRFLYVDQDESGKHGRGGYNIFSWKNIDNVPIEGDSALIEAEPAYFINGTCPADAPFAVWGDSNGGVYIMTETNKATILSYCTNDTTSPHTYTDLYPHIRLESILDYELAGAEFQVYTTSSSAKAVRASDGKTLTASTINGVATIGNVGYGTWTVTAGNNTATIEVREFKQYKVFATLNDYSWEEISAVSASGDAANLFSVGDCKAVTLNGDIVVPSFVIALSLSSYSTCVYILDFDHDMSSTNGTKDGITFGTFKTAVSNGVDVALLSSQYGSDGSYFGMNTTSTNSGGWKSSYMRYTVLGSTDTRNGDATATTATSPREGTLMSCFPSDLRAVMRPMYIYTDNTGGTSDTASYVTGTLDYLPLLAEFEVFGTRTNANSAEQNYQTQYQYYKDGNSKVKHRHSRTSLEVPWWERSIATTYTSSFCMVTSGGTSGSQVAKYSYSLAPMFKV